AVSPVLPTAVPIAIPAGGLCRAAGDAAGRGTRARRAPVGAGPAAPSYLRAHSGSDDGRARLRSGGAANSQGQAQAQAVLAVGAAEPGEDPAADDRVRRNRARSRTALSMDTPARNHGAARAYLRDGAGRRGRAGRLGLTRRGGQ